MHAAVIRKRLFILDEMTTKKTLCRNRSYNIQSHLFRWMRERAREKGRKEVTRTELRWEFASSNDDFLSVALSLPRTHALHFLFLSFSSEYLRERYARNLFFNICIYSRSLYSELLLHPHILLLQKHNQNKRETEWERERTMNNRPSRFEQNQS